MNYHIGSDARMTVPFMLYVSPQDKTRNINCKLQIINYKLIRDYGKHFFKDCSRRDS